MKTFKNILCDPKISSGSPTIKGRRLTVFNIVSRIYYEKQIDIVADDFEIDKTQIADALEYCKMVACREDKTLVNFCSGCFLRSVQDQSYDFNSIKNVVDLATDITKIDYSHFFSNKSDYKSYELGMPGWKMSEEIVLNE